MGTSEDGADLATVDPHVVRTAADETDGEYVRFESTTYPGGDATDEGVPGLLRLAVTTAAHPDGSVSAAGVPVWIQRVGFGALGWLGRRLSYVTTQARPADEDRRSRGASAAKPSPQVSGRGGHGGASTPPGRSPGAHPGIATV